MPSDGWRKYAASYKPLVEAGREPIPLEKCPKNLDFTKTVSGTTYTVKSHFDPQAHESMLRIILRWLDGGTDILDSSL